MAPSMLPRLILRSLWSRRARAAVAFLAIATGCSLAVSMAQVGADAEAKLRRELRIFGANVALLPTDPGTQQFAVTDVDRFAARIPAGRLRACSPALEAT